MHFHIIFDYREKQRLDFGGKKDATQKWVHGGRNGGFYDDKADNGDNDDSRSDWNENNEHFMLKRTPNGDGDDNMFHKVFPEFSSLM